MVIPLLANQDLTPMLFVVGNFLYFLYYHTDDGSSRVATFSHTGIVLNTNSPYFTLE